MKYATTSGDVRKYISEIVYFYSASLRIQSTYKAWNFSTALKVMSNETVVTYIKKLVLYFINYLLYDSFSVLAFYWTAYILFFISKTDKA